MCSTECGFRLKFAFLALFSLPVGPVSYLVEYVGDTGLILRGKHDPVRKKVKDKYRKT